MKRIAAAAIALLLLLGSAFSWGQDGHRIVGEIAQRHLSTAASDAIRELLDGHSLAQISTLPDEFRSDPRWSCATPFHFVTLPPGMSYPDPEFEDWDDGDALRAVVFLGMILLDPSSSKQLKADALTFLVHFVGDLHQPLHVGRGCDRGGNDISVRFQGQPSNLHAVWDSGLIESLDLSFSEYSDFIDTSDAATIDTAQAAAADDWISEAQAHHEQIYKCDTDRRGDRCPCFCGNCEDKLSTFGGCGNVGDCRLQVSDQVLLGYRYKFRTGPILDKQLLTGGLRLAALLDSIFADGQMPDSFTHLESQLAEIEGWDTALKACFTPE